MVNLGLLFPCRKLVSIALVLVWYCIAILEPWYCIGIVLLEKSQYCSALMLRRLKGLGASWSEMLDVFQKQIRCMLEMAVAVWEPAPKQAKSRQLERVQQCAVYIIMGDKFINYNLAFNYLGCERLSER